MIFLYIKVELNSKIISTKKFSLDEHLDSIREKIKDKIGSALFIDKSGNAIKNENEKDICLKDAVDNNILKLLDLEKNKASNIKILLNGQDFCSINCSEDDSLEKLRNLLNNKIQDFEFLDQDDNPVDKEDENEFTIKENLVNGSIKIKSNSKIINKTPNQSENIQKENSNHNSNSSEKNKKELDISNIDKELIEFLTKLSNSKEELNKCFKIFIDNGIASMNDLLLLSDSDIETLKFTLVFKKKLIEELNKKRPKKDISNTEKNIIKSLYEKDCSIDDLLTTLAIILTTLQLIKIQKKLI